MTLSQPCVLLCCVLQLSDFAKWASCGRRRVVKIIVGIYETRSCLGSNAKTNHRHGMCFRISLWISEWWITAIGMNSCVLTGLECYWFHSLDTIRHTHTNYTNTLYMCVCVACELVRSYTCTQKRRVSGEKNQRFVVLLRWVINHYWCSYFTLLKLLVCCVMYFDVVGYNRELTMNSLYVITAG